MVATTAESLQRSRIVAYQISIPFEDIRIAPAEAGDCLSETEELLLMLAKACCRRWQNRATLAVLRK